MFEYQKAEVITLAAGTGKTVDFSDDYSGHFLGGVIFDLVENSVEVIDAEKLTGLVDLFRDAIGVHDQDIALAEFNHILFVAPVEIESQG